VARGQQLPGQGPEGRDPMDWIVLIIVGAVIGLLGKFFAPGDKDNTPLWLTVILGIVGTLIVGAFMEASILMWVLAVVVSAVLVMIASTMMGRNVVKPKH
jgi:uncharacterized membrane protein YeaQ/YmgE (transglycosylase-associated protein family)